MTQYEICNQRTKIAEKMQNANKVHKWPHFSSSAVVLILANKKSCKFENFQNDLGRILASRMGQSLMMPKG
jgi:hypothetical protein